MIDVEAKVETCQGCMAPVRWFPMMEDHEDACPLVLVNPLTDEERAQALAIEFERLSDHWPQAAETARLLRKVK